MAVEALAVAALETGAEEAAMEAAKQLSEKVMLENMKTGTELSLNNAVSDVGSQRPGLSLEQMNDGRDMSATQSVEDAAVSDLKAKVENATVKEDPAESPENISPEVEGPTEENFGEANEVRSDTEDVASTQDISDSNPERTGDVEQMEDKNSEIEADKKAYVEDVKSRSPCPETIDEDAVCESEFKRISPEENAEKRMEFDEKKDDLIREWEQKNGREWPRYEKDVYSENGRLIRRAGMRYDAHHIKPLCMGGENTAENLTPLHAEDHYDHQGVHASDSPYSKLMKEV